MHLSLIILLIFYTPAQIEAEGCQGQTWQWGWLLGEGSKRNLRFTLWMRGVQGTLVLNGSSNTADSWGNLVILLHLSLRKGRAPRFCSSGQVDLYLGIFILDCKAQFTLCTIPTIISLALLFMLGSPYKVILQEINSLEKIQARKVFEVKLCLFSLGLMLSCDSGTMLSIQAFSCFHSMPN